MKTYAWETKTAKRGEEQPPKTHDHGPDGFRYFAKTQVPHWWLACLRVLGLRQLFRKKLSTLASMKSSGNTTVPSFSVSGQACTPPVCPNFSLISHKTVWITCRDGESSSG